MHVIDLEGNEYALQATTTNDYELNGNQSISFIISPSKANKLFIENITELWRVVDHDDVTHKIIYLKKRGSGDSLSVEVKGIPLFFDDFDSQRVYEEYNRHMTANACFNIIFEDSGYNFILNGSFEAIQWEGFGAGDTRLELFKRALERYKAEFRISGNNIYIENQIGRDTQFMYRYKLNASNIVLEHDASAYYTYAKGYGNYGDGDGGEDWKDAKLIREYTHPLSKIPAIGIRHAPPIKNGNITSRTTMDNQLKILVDESLKISVTATLHDLRKQNYPMAQPEIGDRAFIIDERIGLNDEVRVVDMRLVRNWKGDVIDLQLTFGTPGLVKRHQSNLQTAISNIMQLLEGKVKLPFSVYDARMQEAIKAMNSALTQLTVLDDGSLAAIDPNNPNNVVILKSTGLFLSEDGGATPKQAIWGGGINANVISTGTMLADRIAGGYLTSLNDVTEFDLNNGRLYIRQGAITIERPDGFQVVNDGILRGEFSVAQPFPPFMDTTDTNIRGQWFEVNSSARRRVNRYTFSHTSRYLKLRLSRYVVQGGGAQGVIYATDTSTGREIWQVSFDNSSNHDAANYLQSYDIDIGLPNGAPKSIVISARTTVSGYPVNLHIGSVSLWG